MTDLASNNGAGADHELVELPLLVSCTQAFAGRLPSQRVLDAIGRCEIAQFGELAQTQPFRIVAFRVLLREFPDRDPSDLWAHAYDVEVEVEGDNPFAATLPTRGQSSVVSGT